MAIGGFEEDISNDLIGFVNQKTSLTLQSEAVFLDYQRKTGDKYAAVFTDFNDDDNFLPFLTFIENNFLEKDVAFVVFFDDLYYECGYHLAILKRELVEQIKSEWDDAVFTVEYPE